MSRLATLLEDFGTQPVGRPQHRPSDDVLETERLESFDQGYRAGWDDAIKAKSDEADEASRTLAQNLQDLTFTYNEAQAQVLASLRPLLDEVVQKMLPAMTHSSLGAHVTEHVMKIAGSLVEGRIQIRVAPGAGDNVSEMLERTSPNLPVSVAEDDTVLPGQAELRFGDREKHIDLAGVTAEISGAIESAFTTDMMAKNYG